MRRFVLISLGLMLIFTGIIAGYFVTNNSSGNSSYIEQIAKKEEEVEDDCIDEEIALEDIINASVQEIKISPNAVLLIKKHYKECGHITKEYVKIPDDLVNKTKEEVQESYKDWEIEHLSEKDVIIIRDFEGICNEHYLIKEKEGNIAIYYLDLADKENLLEITNISTEYLPEEDLEALRQGIRVNGREELNAMIEDYE